MQRFFARLVLALAVTMAGVVSTDAAPRQRHAPRPHRAEPSCPRAGDRPVTVARAIAGDTFIAGDGHEIDLAGIMAPAAARGVLEKALSAGAVTMALHGEPDRYGRLKAQVFAGGEWVQARLLTDGLVWAAPDLASAPCAPALVAIENRAREARAGHWGDGAFAVRAPDDLRRTTGTFQIVEGVVRTAAVVRSRVYLNFGADWKTDFTATIAPEDKAAFRRVRVDWKAMAGKRVRVRGWIEFYNGPLISLHAPGEIEFLDAMPKPQRRPRKPRTPRASQSQTPL